jgi:hypothetical protein
MPDHEAHGRAVYDHTNDEPVSGRRRRQVSDWGVGEELFDHMPGPRFGRERRPGGHAIPRGGANDGRRTIVIENDGDELPLEPPRRRAGDEEFASREEALRAREQHDALWGGDEPFADDAGAEDGLWGGDEPFADDVGGEDDVPRAGDEPVGDDAPRRGNEPIAHGGADRVRGDDALTAGIARGGVEGRRTVKIGGRPPEFYPARRPPRAVHDRLGPRPDRIAAWAFALGLLLIIIAIVTQ